MARHGRAFPIKPHINTKLRFGAGSLYTNTLSDTVTLADVLERSTSRTLSEVVTIVDTLEALRAQFKTLEETVTIADTLLKSTSRTLEETTTIVDSVLRTPSRTLNDALTVSDTLLKTPGKVLSEAITIVDSAVTAGSQYFRTFTEVATIVDTNLKTPSRTFSEALALNDEMLKTPGKVLSEAVTVTDTIVRVTSRTLAEAVPIVDTIETLKAQFKELTEEITIVDALLKTPARTLAEAIPLVDSLLKTPARTLSDTITVRDEWDNGYQYRRPVTIDETKVAGSSNLTNFVMQFAGTYSWLKSVANGGRAALGGGCEVFDSAIQGTAALKAYYRFESGALTTDSSGNSNTLTAISDPAETTGYFGGGVALDGNDAYSMTDDADFKPTGEFSVVARFKTSTSGKMIINAMSQNTNVAGWFLDCGLNGANKVSFCSGKNTGVTANTHYKLITSETTITDNAWHVAVGVWDGARMKLYIDGVLEASAPWTDPPAYAATTYVRIGCDNQTGTNASFFTGDLDEIAVIHEALTAQAVRFLSIGLDLRFETATGTKLSHEIETYNPTTGAIVAWVEIPTLTYDTDTTIYAYTNKETLTASEEDPPGTWTAYEAAWHFDESSIDARGNFHGTDTTMVYAAANGLINKGASFGGASRIAFGNSIVGAGAKSVSFLMKASSPTDFQTIFSNNTWDANSDGIAMYVGSGGQLNFQVRIQSSGSSPTVTTTGSLYDGNWHLIDCTFTGDGTTNGMKVYVDGQLNAQGTGATDIAPDDFFYLGSARRTSNEYNYNGNLDEFRLASTTLTAGWIETNYNTLTSPSTFYEIGTEEKLGFSYSLVFGATLTEIITLVDTIVRAPARTLTETVPIEDVFEGARLQVRTLTEEIVIVDTLLRTTSRAFTEALTITDIFSDIITGIDARTVFNSKTPGRTSWGRKTLGRIQWSSKTPSKTTWSQADKNDPAHYKE